MMDVGANMRETVEVRSASTSPSLAADSLLLPSPAARVHATFHDVHSVDAPKTSTRNLVCPAFGAGSDRTVRTVLTCGKMKRLNFEALVNDNVQSRFALRDKP